MKKGLGKGLGALLSGVQSTAESHEAQLNDTPVDGVSATSENGVLMVDIRKVEPNPTQPRQFFDEDALDELAESMKTFGIVQPLLVIDEGEMYTIIAGERRYRAARKAKLKEVPVIVKNYTEMEILQVALIENIQRQDLTSIEEATCYKRLMDDFFFSADDVAGKLGKNKHAVISALHLLELTPKAQQLAAEGKLTASHAKVLLAVEDEELQGVCAEKIAEVGLSVREAETMVTSVLKAAAKKAALDARTAEEEAIDNENAAKAESIARAYKNAENHLQQVLGSQVHIIPGKKKSKIEIEYYSVADLERIMEIFKSIPMSF
ncbi:MAG: ParB/RepB/Spo0J family partition protein [Defluviitaleaceae bacterium]|nr:ParB/RepB/Spo0J family partition protein [Defluviitaleaceae bacterium]